MWQSVPHQIFNSTTDPKIDLTYICQEFIKLEIDHSFWNVWISIRFGPFVWDLVPCPLLLARYIYIYIYIIFVHICQSSGIQLIMFRAGCWPHRYLRRETQEESAIVKNKRKASCGSGILPTPPAQQMIRCFHNCMPFSADRHLWNVFILVHRWMIVVPYIIMFWISCENIVFHCVWQDLLNHRDQNVKYHDLWNHRHQKMKQARIDKTCIHAFIMIKHKWWSRRYEAFTSSSQNTNRSLIIYNFPLFFDVIDDNDRNSVNFVRHISIPLTIPMWCVHFCWTFRNIDHHWENWRVTDMLRLYWIL